MTSADNQVQPYEHLAGVYDQWTVGNDYERWMGYVRDVAGRLGATGGRALDVCCGTGRMTVLLAAAGFDVTGVDISPAMLEHARRTVPGAVLHEHDVTEPLPLANGSLDLAVCSFDSANYLVEDGALAAMFSAVSSALRPGGVFVLDLNSQHKLEDVFGSSHYGDDLGEFAYVWRNRTDSETRRTEFLITLFFETSRGCRRSVERHVQRWFADDEVRSAASGAGLRVAEVTDDYGLGAVSTTTLRETWVLQRMADPAENPR